MAGILFASIGLGVDRFLERRQRKKIEKVERRKALMDSYYPPLPTSESEARARIARKRRRSTQNSASHSEHQKSGAGHLDPGPHAADRRYSEPAGRMESGSGLDLTVTPAEFDREMAGDMAIQGEESGYESAGAEEAPPPRYEDVVGMGREGVGGHGRR